jgi:hypothetical protein
LILLPHAALGWNLLLAAKINDSQLLQEFSLHDFSFCLLAQSSEVPNSQSERFGDAWPLYFYGQDSLREFRIQAFFFSLFMQSSEVQDFHPHVLLIWTVKIHFRSSGFVPFLLPARAIL